MPGYPEPARFAGVRKFGLSLTIIAFGIFLLGLLWSTVIVKLDAEREAEIASITKHAANLSRAVEEHATRTIKEADQVLLFIENQYREHGSNPDLRQLIEDGPILSRIYTYLSIIDEHGNLAAGSGPFKPVNLSDREHFQVHVAGDILFQPFISKPVVGRASGRTSIQITRRINKPDTTFGGVAVASIDPQYFSGFYREVDLGNQGFITLVGLDGIVRARHTRDDTTVGQDLSKVPLFRHLKTAKTASYQSISPLDGVRHLISYRSLPNYALVAVVGVGTEEAMAGYNQRARNYYAAAALASAAIVVFTALLLAMVSRQRRTEEALRLRNIELGRTSMANAQLAAIVEDSNDAIVSRDGDYRITSWNAAAERLFGYTAAEALGRNIDLIVPPDQRAAMMRGRAVLAQGQPLGARDAVRIAKDGRRIDVSLTQSPINDENGKMTGASLVFRDISERKRAEAELAQLAAIVESSEDAIVSRSLDSRILSWNPAAERLFGWTEAEAIGRSVSMLIPPEHEAEAARNRAQLTAGGRPVVAHDTTRLTKDGRRIPVSITQSPVRNERGETIAVSINFRDISERKQAEERYRATFNSAPIGILHVDLERRILEVNPKLCEILGYAREELVNKPLDTIIHPDYRGTDYRSYAKEMLDNRLPTFSSERQYLRKDGSGVWVKRTISLVRDVAGQPLYFVRLIEDISERKRAEAQVEYLSQHDALTMLPNRSLLRDRIETAAARARRRGEIMGVIVLGIDAFKRINESLGTTAGDELLRAVAARLKYQLRDVDTIARLGGDEFAVLVDGVEKSGDVTAVAEKISQALAIPFTTGGQEVSLSGSFGVATYPDGASDPGVLLENAEIAMTRIKREGGGGIQSYDTQPHTERGQRFTIETHLRRAIDNGELAVHYQPKECAVTGAIAGVEALVRWNSPQLGAVSPGQFIPIAEETGLIEPVGQWVLREACRQARAWHDQGLRVPVAVNLSPRQFRKTDVTEMISAALEESGLDPVLLEIEITEGTAMTHPDQAAATLNKLRGIGVHMALDDFGTGYSSLAYLKRFPLNKLKIDQAFVREISADPDSTAIVQAVIALARSLRLRTVAEGVETEAQRSVLKLLGCDEFQGYLLCKPLPPKELTEWLRRRATVVCDRSVLDCAPGCCLATRAGVYAAAPFDSAGKEDVGMLN